MSFTSPLPAEGCPEHGADSLPMGLSLIHI